MCDTLEKLNKVILERKDNDPSKSYVAKLFTDGTEKISQKVGEEAVETIIAALSGSKEELISESADLMFHLSVLWGKKDITPSDIMNELERRMGISGLDEKAARKANGQ